MLPAFGVRVGSRNKTFIVMLGKARKCQTIGRYPAWTLLKAREKARLMISGSEGAQSTVYFDEAIEIYRRALTIRTRRQSRAAMMRQESRFCCFKRAFVSQASPPRVMNSPGSQLRSNGWSEWSAVRTATRPARASIGRHALREGAAERRLY